VRKAWQGPLFVKVSADEYDEGGNGIDDHRIFATYMKEQGVDLIDVSSGGVTDHKPEVFPGYQVRYAQAIRRQSKLPTAAVGLITTGNQAEEILREEAPILLPLGAPCCGIRSGRGPRPSSWARRFRNPTRTVDSGSRRDLPRGADENLKERSNNCLTLLLI